MHFFRPEIIGDIGERKIGPTVRPPGGFKKRTSIFLRDPKLFEKMKNEPPAPAHFDPTLDPNSNSNFGLNPNPNPNFGPLRDDENLEKKSLKIFPDPLSICFHHYENFFMENATPFERRSIFPLESCAKLCIESSDRRPMPCRAFTFHSRLKICDLFAVTAKDDQMKLRMHGEFSYFWLK